MRMTTGGVLFGTTALLMAGISTHAVAQDSNPRVEGIVTGTYQAASETSVDGRNVHNEANGELYLFGALDMGPGSWNLEVRGSTTPRKNGVSRFYDSNALVGETLDSDGDGRIAATQLFYELPVGPGRLRAGLLDPTALLDGNDIANDEYSQFLSGAFVNNPSIGFPSFVLGGAYVADATEHLSYEVFIGSDSGLEAEDDPSYNNVFDLGGKRGDYDKGAFTTIELDWQANGYSLQGGVWYDSGKTAQVGRSTGSEHGYGLYTLAGVTLGPGHVEARAAIVNDKAQTTANFLSLAYQLPVQLSNHESTLGVGIARTGDSSELVFNSEPTYQAEAYWRINIAGSLYVSPDVQYFRHAGFEAARDDVVIGGARVGLEF